MTSGTRNIRAVLHAHSTWSYDGSWDLGRIAGFYGRLGVQAVMMTEHDTGFDPDSFETYRQACAAASTARCTLIPGIEYSCPDNDIHVLTWGLRSFLAEHRPVTETLNRVAEAGGVAVFAHPIRRDAWSKFDPAWVPLLSGIEIWNRKSDGIAPGVRALELRKATGLSATVGQDFHKLRHAYPLTQLITIKPGANLEDELVLALQQGKTIPQAYRRTLWDEQSGLRPGPHATLEKLRQRARDFVRGKPG